MSRGPEALVKDKVKALCKNMGVYYHMPVQAGMGKPTLDFIICAYGFFIGVETKALGKKATRRQEITMAEMQAANGYTLVVDGDETLNKLRDLVIICKANYYDINK